MKFRNVLYLALLISAPLVVFAAPRTYRELVEYLIKIMNYTIGTLVVAGLVIYFFGIARNMMKAKDGDASQQRNFIIMGVIIIFVMVSIWGILRLLRATFF